MYHLIKSLLRRQTKLATIHPDSKAFAGFFGRLVEVPSLILLVLFSFCLEKNSRHKK